MSAITVDVRNFEPTGPIPAVTIKRARVSIDATGPMVSTAPAETVYPNDASTTTFDLTAGKMYRLEVTGLSGIRAPFYVTGPATGKALSGLYRQDRIDPITLQPLPAYPSIAAAIADLRQQLLDFIGIDEGDDATTAAALAARPTRAEVSASYVPLLTPVSTYTWNPDGTISSLTVGGLTTTFTWNSDGTLATETRDGVTRTYSYSGGTLASVA